MPKRKYVVRLTEKEREELRSIVSKGKSSSRTIKRAHVLLRLDSNADVKCDINELHKVLGISRTTVNNILKDYKRRGVECIWRKKRKTPPVKGKITGEVEAHLIALAPHHQGRWLQERGCHPGGNKKLIKVTQLGVALGAIQS